MKRIQRTKTSILPSVLLGVVFVLSGCANLRAAPAPSTKFLNHEENAPPAKSNLPWNSVWMDPKDTTLGYHAISRKIFFTPINDRYLNDELPEVPTIEQSALEKLSESLRMSFKEAIENDPMTNLKVVDSAKGSDLSVELALTQLVPTETSINTVANIGGLIVPGSKLVQSGAAIGVPAVGGALAAGSVAIEIKIKNSRKNKIVVELKDRQTDPASLLPNYRDFQQYGWSKETITKWAQQFATSFSTPLDKMESPASTISLVPW